MASPAIAALPGIGAAGNSGKHFLGLLAGSKIADAFESLAGDVAEEGPEFRPVVGNPFAVIYHQADGFLLRTLAGKPFHPVDLIGIEGRWQPGRRHWQRAGFHSRVIGGLQGGFQLPDGHVMEVE